MTDELLHHTRKLLANDYDIHRELGRGGMAIVYSATHRRDGRKVAIKVLPPMLAFNATARERFVREARLAAALDHPGIVPVYSAAVTDDVAWFVMARVEGESLGARVAREKRLSIADAQFILAQIADALGYAHAAGVVHRDVKPDNILLDAASGRPMLTDFGIARALDDDAEMTAEGIALGTPHYMSPEQAMGTHDIDGRSDIYSLGVLGYQLLTGTLPFTASNARALMARHLSHRPTPLLELRPDAPLAMVAAIDGALEKNRAARWQSASAFRAALGELPTAVVHTAPSPTLRARSPGPAARAASVVNRITAFRRNALQSLALAGLTAVLNVITEPDFLFFLFVSALLAIYLVFKGAALYAEDIPIKDLFVGDPRGHVAAPRPPVHPSSIRYESLHRGAERDHSEIRRILGGLSDGERALIPDAGTRADALRDRIEWFVTELRELGPHVDVAMDISGSVLSQLDSAADAMHAVRLQLMNLRDAGFAQGLDAFNVTLERAHTLS